MFVPAQNRPTIAIMSTWYQVYTNYGCIQHVIEYPILQDNIYTGRGRARWKKRLEFNSLSGAHTLYIRNIPFQKPITWPWIRIIFSNPMKMVFLTHSNSTEEIKRSEIFKLKSWKRRQKLCVSDGAGSAGKKTANFNWRLKKEKGNFTGDGRGQRSRKKGSSSFPSLYIFWESLDTSLNGRQSKKREWEKALSFCLIKTPVQHEWLGECVNG